MRKLLFALVLVLLSGSFGLPSAWGGPYTHENGVLSYIYYQLLEAFNNNEYAIKKELKDKLVEVWGRIVSVREGDYFPDPSDFSVTPIKAPAIILGDKWTRGDFVGYLFDDLVDPATLLKDHFVYMLCEDVQRKPGGVGLQGKCRVVTHYEKMTDMDNSLIYRNQELFDWLNTPAQGKAEAE